MNPFNKKQKLTIAGCLIAFAIIKIALLWLWQQQENAPSAAIVQCNVAQEGCEFEAGQRLQLIGVGNNKTPFAAKLTGLPESVQSVSLSFSMRDMEMGFNRFELKKQADSSWQIAAIHLPLCSSNRHDWLVNWQIDGKNYQAPFQTQAQ